MILKVKCIIASSLLLFLTGGITGVCGAGEHPRLLLTAAGSREVRQREAGNAMFERSLAKVLADADLAVGSPIEVPLPRDGGGGYTHEKHKENYYAMFNCGIAWQLTGVVKYADFVRDMLQKYSVLYPTLDYHPVELSPVRGRLFWQTLNESVWLVHTSIAYDCVYDALTEDERRRFEECVFGPVARFIMDGNDANRRTFNKMHNHGTWATAAVGMAGYATGNREWVDKALYGSDMTGKTGGFLRQLHELFSPDGYFTEGAYYHRYAIWPVVVFARAIENNDPSIGIFAYRNSIISKALYALLNLAYDGDFFLFNDALPKGFDAQELVYAVDVVYGANPEAGRQLLDIAARYQRRVLPTGDGYAVARDIELGKSERFTPTSLLLRDGADGTQGGVAVLRRKYGKKESALFFKATSHGLSHGHYDKLMFSYYDNGLPVIRDYGAARFVNIEAKYKGHYTPENKSFAMSSIAHNTVTVDGRSQFGGDYELSSRHASQIWFADVQGADIEIVSGKEENAYEGVGMHRTMALVSVAEGVAPLVIDIFRLNSHKPHTYDYPVYYNGHMISVNFPYSKSLDKMVTLGDTDGYQHLWVEARGEKFDEGRSVFTWLAGDRFYTINTLVGEDSEAYFVRTGASDPGFHLRSEPAFIMRQNSTGGHTYFSVIESHGKYDMIAEQTTGATTSVEKMELLYDSQDHTIARIWLYDGKVLTLMVSNADNSEGALHSVKVGGESFEWRGPYAFSKE